jgi:hypothetical protein
MRKDAIPTMTREPKLDVTREERKTSNISPIVSELEVLQNDLLSGKTDKMKLDVENSLSSGATEKDIVKVVEHIVGGENVLYAIVELLKVLRFREYDKMEPISVLDDVRED